MVRNKSQFVIAVNQKNHHHQKNCCMATFSKHSIVKFVKTCLVIQVYQRTLLYAVCLFSIRLYRNTLLFLGSQYVAQKPTWILSALIFSAYTVRREFFTSLDQLTLCKKFSFTTLFLLFLCKKLNAVHFNQV